MFVTQDAVLTAQDFPIRGAEGMPTVTARLLEAMCGNQFGLISNIDHRAVQSNEINEVRYRI